MKNKKVFGVGINDSDHPIERRTEHLGERTVLWRCPFYMAWWRMLRRAYSAPFKPKNPTYLGVTVCEEWMLFSSFEAWMKDQDWQGKQLDKDLLSPGNKEYSPEKCCFVSRAVNSFMTEKKSNKGPYPVGVYWNKSQGVFLARCRSVETGKQIHAGSSMCPDHAHGMWVAMKIKQARILAGRQTDPRIAAALIHRYENYNAHSCAGGDHEQ